MSGCSNLEMVSVQVVVCVYGSTFICDLASKGDDNTLMRMYDLIT